MATRNECQLTQAINWCCVKERTKEILKFDRDLRSQKK